MSGKDAIIEKIRADARGIVASTLEEGDKKALEIIRVAQNDAKIYRDKFMEESYAERDEIIRRKITVANLEVKKMMLAAKQELMDQAFSKAKAAVRGDKKAYEKMLVGMLACAEDGDTVTFSEADKEWVTDEWFSSAIATLGKKLTKNAEYGDFCGGLIASGKGSDKNFSLEVELEGVREACEPEIASLLFGEVK